MIVVIADDLTGAAELAALGARHGMTAEVHTALNQTCATDLVAVDTNSRLSRPETARARVCRAAHHILTWQPAWIYKKVDSVLRGWVLAETEALMQTLKLSRALLLPTNPSLGRVIRMGRYYVQGRPIDQTDFKNDPQYPRRSSKVMELVGSACQGQVHLRRSSEVLPMQGIIIGEAESGEDLLAWAGHLDETTLAVGGAEFFAAILHSARRRTKGCSPVQPAAVMGKSAGRLGGHLRFTPAYRAALKTGKRGTKAFAQKTKPGHAKDLPSFEREMFICGSASESTRNFIAESSRRGLPVVSMPPGLAKDPSRRDLKREWVRKVVEAFGAHTQVIVAINQPLITDSAVAGGLCNSLVDAVRAVLARLRMGQLFVEGGETARLLIQRMGWRRLRVTGELAQGVASMRADSPEGCSLTMKPGSYTWPESVWR